MNYIAVWSKDQAAFLLRLSGYDILYILPIQLQLFHPRPPKYKTLDQTKYPDHYHFGDCSRYAFILLDDHYKQ